MYTAIVVPAVIAFHWLDAECQAVPTLFFDCVLDTFFIVDIIYSFFVGVTYQGQYYDDYKWVVRHYVSGGFLFDVATSIPVSYIELIANAACSQAEGAPSQQLRFVRALKPLRWFKLARVMKLNKGGAVLAVIFDHFMLSPKVQRKFMVLFSIVGSIHLGACASFLVKVVFSTPAEVDLFLVQHSKDQDNPIDLSTVDGKLEAYALCTYFIMTVFTTIGFGDVTPANSSERAIAVFLMLWVSRRQTL